MKISKWYKVKEKIENCWEKKTFKILKHELINK